MGINDHDTFTGLAPLHDAARDGDLEKVIALLDDGADGNIRACGEVRPRARRAKTRWWMNSSIERGGRGGRRGASRAAGRGGIRCDGGRLGIGDRGATRTDASETDARDD